MFLFISFAFAEETIWIEGEDASTLTVTKPIGATAAFVGEHDTTVAVTHERQPQPEFQRLLEIKQREVYMYAHR